MNKKILAIIPARGGSKGIKDKNIKPLNGKPLIYYSIHESLESNIIQEVMVNTDSEKIASISKKYGANIPFLRSKELATDEASSVDVIEDTLNYYEQRNISFDYFILLQPTSPLRTREDIIRAFEILEQKNAKSIVSVCEAEHSPLLMNKLDNDLSMKDFLKKENDKRRQDFDKYYRLNGAIYISEVKNFLETKNFYGEGSYAYIMPNNRSVDIDNEIDLKLAEIIMRDYL
jgi:CMP-N-acetylneuraminic acid synthetase